MKKYKIQNWSPEIYHACVPLSPWKTILKPLHPKLPKTSFKDIVQPKKRGG
jgi:hypothetical protein